MFDVLPVMKLEPTMRFPLTTLKRSFLAALFILGSLGHGWAQATDASGNVTSPIVFQAPDAITATLVDVPPGTHGDNSGGGSTAQWLKVEFHYSVDPKGGVPFLDSVEFRIWIEGRDLYDTAAKTAEGLPVGLTGSVTYLNLAPTKDAYGVFYVHPSVLARYCTKQGPGDFERKFNIHIEAYVKGAKVDYFDKNKEPDLTWFSQLRAVPGMVDRQDQCVFMCTDAARYPQMKLSSQ